MDEKKNVPQVRIGHFTSNWNEELLCYYLETSKAKNIDESFLKEDVLSVSGDFGVVNQMEHQGKSFAGASLANYGVVSTNEVVYTKSPLRYQPYGIIKTNMGEPGIVSALYAVYHPKDTVYAPFVQTYFNLNKRLNNYLRPIISKGAKNTINVGDDAALLGTVFFPQCDEQQAITELFLNLERLIVQNQSKLEKLQNLKLSMLEKMFPKDGADVPEVRFKGFNRAWKRKRFSELYESVTQKNDLTYGVDKNITVASMQYRPDIRVTDIEYLRTYNVLRLGDIAFEGHQSKEFRYGRFVENDIGDGIVSHIFAVFRPKTDYDLMFWKYAINNERIMRSMLVRCTKASTMMNDLVAKDFLEESILVPDIEEQKKIGATLSEIDRLISLQREGLKKLQSFKKALLEKMFV